MEGPCFVNDGGMGAVAVREYPGQAGRVGKIVVASR